MSKKIILIGSGGLGESTHILNRLKKIHGEDNVVHLTEEELKEKLKSGEITDYLINPPLDDEPFVIENIAKAMNIYVDDHKPKRSWTKNNRHKK